MTTAARLAGEQPGHYRLSTLHILLGIQSIVIVLASINRLTSLMSGYVAPNEFLRWLDFNNMLVFPIISLVAFYLLKKRLEYPGQGLNSRWHLALNIAFLLGLYLLGASYGDHEVTNYLNARFCIGDEAQSSAICQIIAFNDDEFSHYLFFIGFVLVNGSLLLFQALFPTRTTVSNRDRLLLIVNGLFIAAGIFANLGFEEIGLDIYVVVLLAALSLWLLWRRGSQSLFVYYTTAYFIGLAATIIVKVVRG